MTSDHLSHTEGIYCRCDIGYTGERCQHINEGNVIFFILILRRDWFMLRLGYSLFDYQSIMPSASVNFISLVTSGVGLQEESSQTARPMSFTWVSHKAASVLMGH